MVGVSCDGWPLGGVEHRPLYLRPRRNLTATRARRCWLTGEGRRGGRGRAAGSRAAAFRAAGCVPVRMSGSRCAALRCRPRRAVGVPTSAGGSSYDARPRRAAAQQGCQPIRIRCSRIDETDRKPFRRIIGAWSPTAVRFDKMPKLTSALRFRHWRNGVLQSEGRRCGVRGSPACCDAPAARRWLPSHRSDRRR